jgi:3-dehydroquinate synthase
MPVSFDVRSAAGNYSVASASNVLAARAAEMRAGSVMADVYFAEKLAAGGVAAIALQANEATKSFDALTAVIVRMRESGAARDTHLWAIGGGAIQDTAAFISSIYMRGIAWTYVPTTLLGMVDSCIGGKSSINVGAYKNLVGTFHPPAAVLIDSALIATLSTEQRIAGLAEAAKICYCRGPDVFQQYLSCGPKAGRAAEGFEPIIALSLGAKKWFVEIDEFDRAERLLLNLGHTFGHALESASGYRLSHGVAVGVGILCALALSQELLHRAPGGAAPLLERHMRALLCEWPELPEALKTIDVASAFDRVRADKKHEAERYRFITFGDSGRVEVTRLAKTEATRSLVMAALRDTLEVLSR